MRRIGTSCQSAIGTIVVGLYEGLEPYVKKFGISMIHLCSVDMRLSSIGCVDCPKEHWQTLG